MAVSLLKNPNRIVCEVQRYLITDKRMLLLTKFVLVGCLSPPILLSSSARRCRCRRSPPILSRPRRERYTILTYCKLASSCIAFLSGCKLSQRFGCRRRRGRRAAKRHALTKHVRFACHNIEVHWPLGDILMFLPSLFSSPSAALPPPALLAAIQQTPIIHMRALVSV